MGLMQWGCPIGWNELCGAGCMCGADAVGQALWMCGADAVGLPHRLERAVWGRPYGAGAMGLTQWGCPIGWNELCGAGPMDVWG